MAQHVKTTIRYDGPALVGHDMDVQDLAPALLALADIVQIANRKFNGDRASMRVLVNADVEQKCFQLDLSLVQSLLDQANTFFGKDAVATARTIAEIIGLTGGVGGTLFGLYKWLFGKKDEIPDGGISFTKSEATGTTIVNITGDGNTVEVTNQVAALASDPEVMKRVKAVLKPLQNPDYTDFSILEEDRLVIQIDREEAAGIIAAPTPALISEEADEGDDTYAVGPAWVDTSHFRGTAKWTLLWSGQRIDAKMPEEFIRQFQANELIVVPNTKLTVRMKVETKVDQAGMPLGAPSFEVEEVLRIDLPPKAATQIDWIETQIPPENMYRQVEGPDSGVGGGGNRNPARRVRLKKKTRKDRDKDD
jgi:hypothetical protein